jgi:tRNA threonylcarbamoyladenosine biosynthesis protein TsaB
MKNAVNTMHEFETFPMPWQTVLAMDSSTEFLSLALRTPAGLWQRDLPLGAQASEQILQQLDALLHESQTPWPALQLLVCGRGPGAFTGVRVAVAVCQGLAFSRGIPILPLSGLLALAENARLTKNRPELPSTFLALQDARMGQVYAAQCQWDGQRWLAEPEYLLNYAEIAHLPESVQPAGNVRLALYEAGLAVPQAWLDARPSALGLLQVAAQELRAGAEVLHDAAALMPVYVRNKVAQTTAERAAASAEKV